jgi:hypothetical protein
MFSKTIDLNFFSDTPSPITRRASVSPIPSHSWMEGRLRERHEVNITRTAWTVSPSLPITDTTYPKKEPMSPPRIRHCKLPHSPKHPGTDTGEDPHHQKPHKCMVEHAHKALLPPRDEVEYDAPTTHRLIGAYAYDTCMYLCAYAPRRRCRGVGRAQPLTDPSPGTMPRICSPFPALVTSCPPPFKFAQEPCFVFFRLPIRYRGLQGQTQKASRSVSNDGHCSCAHPNGSQ